MKQILFIDTNPPQNHEGGFIVYNSESGIITYNQRQEGLPTMGSGGGTDTPTVSIDKGNLVQIVKDGKKLSDMPNTKWYQGFYDDNRPSDWNNNFDNVLLPSNNEDEANIHFYHKFENGGHYIILTRNENLFIGYNWSDEQQRYEEVGFDKQNIDTSFGRLRLIEVVPNSVLYIRTWDRSKDVYISENPIDSTEWDKNLLVQHTQMNQTINGRTENVEIFSRQLFEDINSFVGSIDNIWFDVNGYGQNYDYQGGEKTFLIQCNGGQYIQLDGLSSSHKAVVKDRESGQFTISEDVLEYCGFGSWYRVKEQDQTDYDYDGGWLKVFMIGQEWHSTNSVKKYTSLPLQFYLDKINSLN